MTDLEVLEIMRRGVHKLSSELSTEDLRASMLWLEIVENNIKRAQEEAKSQDKKENKEHKEEEKTVEFKD